MGIRIDDADGVVAAQGGKGQRGPGQLDDGEIEPSVRVGKVRDLAIGTVGFDLIGDVRTDVLPGDLGDEEAVLLLHLQVLDTPSISLIEEPQAGGIAGFDAYGIRALGIGGVGGQGYGEDEGITGYGKTGDEIDIVDVLSSSQVEDGGIGVVAGVVVELRGESSGKISENTAEVLFVNRPYNGREAQAVAARCQAVQLVVPDCSGTWVGT